LGELIQELDYWVVSTYFPKFPYDDAEYPEPPEKNYPAIREEVGKSFPELGFYCTVDYEHSEGKPVYFGDAQRPEALRAAGVADARLVIVSIDDFKATERVVSSLHSAFPDVPVFARGHDLDKCRDLKAQGLTSPYPRRLNRVPNLAGLLYST
jgi:voltage-gated potassium channel Kch